MHGFFNREATTKLCALPHSSSGVRRLATPWNKLVEERDGACANEADVLRRFSKLLCPALYSEDCSESKLGDRPSARQQIHGASRDRELDGGVDSI